MISFFEGKKAIQTYLALEEKVSPTLVKSQINCD